MTGSREKARAPVANERLGGLRSTAVDDLSVAHHDGRRRADSAWLVIGEPGRRLQLKP
jgi:hypothetical protein